MMTDESAERVYTIDGKLLKRMFRSAAVYLSRAAEDIDSINVFPVPDGDTGTNMLITLEAALEQECDEEESRIGFVSAAMAKGALHGASGNAGVIFSQFLTGLSQSFKGKEAITNPELAEALQVSSEYAYKSMTEPVEGTMLTVIREIAAEAVQEAAAGNDMISLMEHIVSRADQAVSETTALLPVLKKNGVVDAGARGIYTILYGLLSGIRKYKGGVELPKQAVFSVRPETAFELEAEKTADFGYCTEFLISGAGLEKETLKSQLAELGSSLIIAGNGDSIRVHIHTNDPGRVLHLGTGIGLLTKISIRNMDEQHKTFLEKRSRKKKRLSTVRIVADSVADLPDDVIEQLNITVVPLIVRFGTRVYRDGVDISVEEFYQRLETGKILPETSIPAPAAFAEAYDRLADETENILTLTLSSKLSGTYNSAVQGIQQMVRSCRVEVVDTGWAALGEGLLVIKAAEAAAAGATIDEIKALIEINRSRIDFLATFDTLEYLVRGGRIGKTKSLLGSLLHIHPLMKLQDGKAASAGSAFSRKGSIRKLLRFTASYRNPEKIGIAYAACREDAEWLTEEIKRLFPKTELLTSRWTPVMGTHTGPGLLLVAVLGDKDSEPPE